MPVLAEMSDFEDSTVSLGLACTTIVCPLGMRMSKFQGLTPKAQSCGVEERHRGSGLGQAGIGDLWGLIGRRG